MTETFSIHSAQWAKEKFPERLVAAALRHHRRDPDNTYGINALIAQDAGVDRSAVTRWMKGAAPKLETILHLADLYDVSPDHLVGNDDLPHEGFSRRDLESRLPYDTLIKVLRIMSELRTSRVSDDWFAQSTVELLKMVESTPDMSDDAITGAAYRLLRSEETG